VPIYAYKCSACGHQQDVLQKLSDPLLTVCPACGQSTYSKQVTAAGFQLKGSGWYVTDFRNNGSKPGSEAGEAKGKGESAKSESGQSSGGDAASGAADKPASTDKPAATAPAAPASTSAAPASSGS